MASTTDPQGIAYVPSIEQTAKEARQRAELFARTPSRSRFANISSMFKTPEVMSEHPKITMIVMILALAVVIIIIVVIFDKLHKAEYMNLYGRLGNKLSVHH